MRGEFDGKEYQRNIKRADEKPGLKKEYATIEKSNIEKLFENFAGEYEPIDADFGEPVGNEIL